MRRIRRTLVSVVSGVAAAAWLAVGAPAVVHAADYDGPFECKAYTGDARENCLKAYIELQNEKMGKLEEELKAQKQDIKELDARIDRQQAADSAQAAPAPAPPVYGYAGGYPYPPGYGYGGYWGPGLGLYLGVPGYYGPRLFYGPRFYGPGYWGPRYYGGWHGGFRHGRRW
jgi:hypothetical protein